MPYTPWKLNQDVVVFPGAIGGGNWDGVAYNKKLNLVITNVMNAGQWGHLEKSDGGADRTAISRGVGGAGRGGRGGRTGGPAAARRAVASRIARSRRRADASGNQKTQYPCARRRGAS